MKNVILGLGLVLTTVAFAGDFSKEALKKKSQVVETEIKKASEKVQDAAKDDKKTDAGAAQANDAQSKVKDKLKKFKK
jgi:hypothetical protein